MRHLRREVSETLHHNQKYLKNTLRSIGICTDIPECFLLYIERFSVDIWGHFIIKYICSEPRQFGLIHPDESLLLDGCI